MNELISLFIVILTLVLIIAVIYMAVTVPGLLRRLLNEFSEGAKRVDHLSAQLNLLSQQLEIVDNNLDRIRALVVEIKMAAKEANSTEQPPPQ